MQRCCKAELCNPFAILLATLQAYNLGIVLFRWRAKTVHGSWPAEHVSMT